MVAAPLPPASDSSAPPPANRLLALAQAGPLERLAKMQRHLIRSGLLLSVLSGVVFLISLWVIWLQLSRHSWRAVVDAFYEIDAFRFWTGAIMVVGSYALITFNDRLALKLIGREVERRKHVAASVAGYAIARSLGYAFITAATARMRLYAAAGLTAAETGRLSLYTGLTAQVGAATATAAGLILGANDLMRRAHTPRSIAIGGAIALLLIVLVWVRNNARGALFSRADAPTMVTLLSHILAAAGAWLCAAGVLFQLMAVHGGLHFPAFVACFVVATVVGALSGVPGGLGVFEATMIAFMPRAQGLPSTAAALVVFRLMYNVAPLAFAAAVLAWDQWSAAQRARLRRRKAQCKQAGKD
jgi:phosphatidylglycerol lysyltransferase